MRICPDCEENYLKKGERICEECKNSIKYLDDFIINHNQCSGRKNRSGLSTKERKARWYQENRERIDAKRKQNRLNKRKHEDLS